jgi:hypothetical protein
VDVAKLAAAWPANTGSSASLTGSVVSVVPATGSPAAGANVVFTITVASQSGGTTPTGSVTLQVDGGTAWGAGGTTVTNQTLAADGTVTYTANFTTAGTHQVLAQYAGDATHAAATGIGEVAVSGGAGKGTFTLKASDVSVKRGSQAASTITVTPSGGYTGTVDISFDTNADTTLANLCYSFTTMTTAGDGTLQVTGSTPVTTQLTFDTNASDCASSAAIIATGMHQFKTLHGSGNLHARITGPAKPGKVPGRSPLPEGVAFAGLVLLGLLGRKSRLLRNVACVAALAVAGFALSACSNSTTNSVSDPPAGTYTVTLTGTDTSTTSITANATFTFTIN